MKLAEITGIKLRNIQKAKSSNLTHRVRRRILETFVQAYVNLRRVTNPELA